MQLHAYAQLEIKALEEAGKRTISGIASTPKPDRQGHIFEPLGARFANPIPLLLHHDSRQPVGQATITASADGLLFSAQLATVAEPGPLRERLEDTWQQLQAGLLHKVSIGFSILEGGAERLANGLLRLLKTEIVEISLTTIPANPDAVVLAVKSLTPECYAPTIPAAPPKGRTMTTAEQITAYENKRAAQTARMTALMTKAADDHSTLADEESTEYDGLEREVKGIDVHLVRLRALEKSLAASAAAIAAVPVTPVSPRITVGPNVPPGTAFVRAACARLVCFTSGQDPIEYAKRWDSSTPEVALYLKAAVAPGTVTDPAWAAPLVTQNVSSEFIDLLRPATILGKIPNLRKAPFNTKVPKQTAGGSYGWVGEAKPKPVTKLAFSSVALGLSKAAGIIVMTKELVKLANPDAEMLVRNDMVKGIAQFLDAQFIDPAVAAVVGVNPASITNGAPTAAATANPMADILGLINHFASNNIDVSGVTFIMSPANALALSFRSNLDGSPQYPGITINGGSWKGLNFVTSTQAGTNVIALQPDLILYASDPNVEIDASQEASLQMDSAPASPADATTVYVSLWQTNSIGMRAEQFVNWIRGDANAVKYLTATAWPAPAGAAVETPAP